MVDAPMAARGAGGDCGSESLWEGTGVIDDSAEALGPVHSASSALRDANGNRGAGATPGDGAAATGTFAGARDEVNRVAGQRTASVLQQREDVAKRAFNRADALMSIVQGYLRGDRPERTPIEMVITIPASALRSGDADPIEVGEMAEGLVSAQAARRLSCDAGVVEVVEGEHGTPLSVGRKRRTIAGALRRALRKRDTACSYPGCTHRMFLEGHHIRHWADGGETSLGNAALLCSLHHRYVHEYGYAIELGEDGRPRFRDPRGRLVAEVPAPRVSGDLGWPRIREMNRPLGISASTVACGWDGKRVNYGAVIGYLAASDGMR
jgi:hypothetical protein